MRKFTIAFILITITIAACSPKTAPTASNKNVPSVFANNCTRCHGPTGTEGRAPDLSKSTLEKDKLVATITNGRERMPEFKDKLSTDEISAVADWILSIRK